MEKKGRCKNIHKTFKFLPKATILYIETVIKQNENKFTSY